MTSRILQKKRAGAKSGDSPGGRRPSTSATGSGTGRLGGGYGMGPAVKLGGTVQTKLTVGKRGDRFEREADRVADSVSNGGKAGDVSRIPAGGLASQRQAEENEPAQTQETPAETGTTEETGQRQAEGGEESEQAQSQGEEGSEETEAQTKCAACEAREKRRTEGSAQRQAEEGAEEGEAQTKCAECEAREKEQKEGRAQRQEDAGGDEGEAQTAEGEEETAQTQSEDEEPAQAATEESEGEETAQTATEEGGDEVQTSAEDGEETARTADEGGEEAPVQRQAEGDAEEGEESTGAAAEGVEGAEDAQVEDCEGPGGGGGEAGPERDEDEEEGEADGGEGAGARDDLGCGGGEGGGEGGEEAAAAGEGGRSCGAATEGAEEASAGGEGGGPATEGAAPAEGEAPPPAGSAPACATEVEAAEEAPDEGRGEEGGGASPAAGAGGSQGECGTAQRQADSEESEGGGTAQTRRAGGGRGRRLDTAAASRHIRSRGSGEPMPPMVRGKLEGGLGVDLRDVRVHADGNAQAANRALRAKAFAHGKDIFLGPGQSPHDVSLMAHETAHVLQQDGVTRRKPVVEAEPSNRSDAGPGAPTAEGAAAPAPARREAPSQGEATPESDRPAEPAGPAGPARASAAGATGAPAGSPGGGPTDPGAATGVSGEGGVGAEPTAAKTERAEKAAEPAKESRGKGGKGGGGGGPGGGGAGGGEGAAIAGPAGDEGPAFPHPGAAAAAAARIAEDRRHRRGVERRAKREAGRQKGPAASPARQRRAAAAAAGAASEAAPSPEAEPRAQAGEAHADALSGAQPGKVEKGTFLDLVNAKLASMKTPASLEEMDEFKEKGGAGELKAGLDRGVKTVSSGATGEVDTTLRNPPPPPPKRQEKPLGPVPATPPSTRLSARKAAPTPRAEEEVTLEPSREAIEKDLTGNRLTEERLRKANDPRFSAVQKSRQEVHEHAVRAPARLRKEEAAKLASTRRRLAGDEKKGKAGMRRAHTATRKAERGRQTTAAQRAAKERRRIAADIEGIYKATEKDVRAKLEWLSGKEGEPGEVDRLFDAGEKDARNAFEKFVDDEMSDWKWRRYGGRASIPIIGGAIAAGTWVYDKVKGIDKHPDVVKIFDDGRDVYLSGLEKTIVEIAGVVESTLAACQERIKKGRKEIKDYVEKKGLDPSLKKVAQEAAKAVSEKFDDLKGEVDATREELADRVADRYQESQRAIDERIKEMQAENRGLAEKFKEKLKEVLDAIRNFKKKIGPILAEAGDVVEDILDDPIGFLKNLLSAIGRGFGQFKARIREYLKKGVIAWLFGNMASIGVEPPKDFSLKALGGVVLDVLGFTAEKMKKRAARIVGPRAMGVLEKVTGYLGTLFREGPTGLWKQIQEDVGNLKEKILEEIKSWVITRIVTAAVKKLAMMFNPVGAIVQAVLMIYDVIMFFLENIDRILDLVKTVVRSVADVVKGKVQAAADKIEKALGATIPLILAFLARLVNLGGVARKIRSVIRRFKAKIDRAISKFLRKLVARFKALGKKGLAKGKAAAAKLLEWWKLKRRFKQGAETHTLSFAGKESAAKLMISSNPRPLVDFLDQRAKTATPAEKKIIAQIRRKTGQIRKLKVTRRKGKQQARYMGQKRGAEISKLFGEIAALLAKLPAATTPVRPKSKVAWSIRRGHEDGQTMVAKPLSIDPGPNSGSEPSEESELWKAVKVRAGAYVRGHLLNHHLHGPGTKKNLTPIPGGDNTRMESSYESRIKKAVLQDNQVVSYTVKAVHGRRPPRTFVPDEKLIATKLQLSAHVLAPNKKAKASPAEAQKPGNWRKGRKLFDEPSFKLTLPADQPVNYRPYASRVNLNRPRDTKFDRAGVGRSIDLVKDALDKLPGIGPERAGIILDNAPYRTFAQMRSLTDASGRQFVTVEVLERLRDEKDDKTGARLFNLAGKTKIETRP